MALLLHSVVMRGFGKVCILNDSLFARHFQDSQSFKY